MKNFFSAKWVLITIILLAAVLRLWHLGSIPPSLNQDEASLGYNTYSILKTGRDEYGSFLPIIFKSFGDYKPGLYIYFDIPFVATLGLNEFSTRLPSALAGVLSVFLIYLITKQLFNQRKVGGIKLEVAAAFVAAFNPYLIYFSRGAWEANVALTLTLGGIYFFLKALKNSRWVILSMILFAATLVTYQGAKLSSAIVVGLMVTVYFKEIKTIKYKHIATGVVAGLLIATPVVLSILNGQASRLTVYSIFSYHRPQQVLTNLLDQGGEKIRSLSYYLFHSNTLDTARGVATRWFNSLSAKLLFFEGDTQNPINTAPYQGILLLTDILFLPLGIFYFIKNKAEKGSIFIFLWLLFAPLAAALSRDQTNAVRSLNMAVPLIIIISAGLLETFYFLEKYFGKKLSWALISFLYVFSLTYFLDAYFIHLPAHNSSLWRYGYKDAVTYVSAHESEYDNIVFEQSYNQPYIYFLFYQKYDPAAYQNIAKLAMGENQLDVGLVNSLGKISFSNIDWEVVKDEIGSLVVASPIKIPQNYSDNAILLDKIMYLNNIDVAFYILKIK